MTSTQTQAKHPTDLPFIRREQTNDFNCWAACIATLAGTSVEEVWDVAVKNSWVPAHGLYWPTDTLIAKTCAHYGLVSTLWKEISNLTHLPDVCIVLAEYNPETEIGRHVVFVRDRRQKPALEFVIDVAPWIDPSQHVRTDFKALIKGSWYITVTPMNTLAAKK
jgi:hypothetical protein